MAALMGYYRLMRPTNMFICGFSVLCGGIIGGRPFTLLSEHIISSDSGEIPLRIARIVLAALSASIILASGNVLNDIMDVQTDRINAPKRPIPSGLVSVRAAAIFAFILSICGIFLAILISPNAVAVALTAVFLLAVYDIKLKGVPLAGNIIVSALGGLAFIYGGIAGDCLPESMLPAIFAFLYHLGREIIKDAADIRGDENAGIKTIATVHGVPAACRLASFILIILTVIVALPSITGYFGVMYTVYIALGVCPVLLYAAASLLSYQSESHLRNISLILKIDMPLGVVAVLVGFQGW
ncbi:MAG: geranylgeranylglycerol-phosphate geranylgeranyltransferase [Candidatus Latescibacteria bacterium]|nr:geranylgeranylglycerol-phosphate geranylgeranyltransferase [Candidatus Latescibacterota bacterium]